jgi:hypothetical protein
MHTSAIRLGGSLDGPATAAVFVVAAAGATLSCTSLAGLARACGYGPWLAWLLPVAVDAYAFVAMRVWLCNGADRRVIQWAAASGWLAIAVSIAGNATYHGIVTGHGASRAADGAWKAGIEIVVLVGAAPAVFVGAAVTLLHLAQPRTPHGSGAVGPPSAPVEADPLPSASLAPMPPPAPNPSGGAGLAGSKTSRLRELVLAEVEPGDGRSVSELARVYAPRLGLHEASARKTIATVLRARTAATGADVVRLSAHGGSR